ncbi:MAG: flagellar biosynthesis anti-sigma factor FlgM [Methylobacter sp.]
MAIEITGRTNNSMPIQTTPKSGIDGDQKVTVVSIETNDDKVALTPTAMELKKSIGASSSTPVDFDRVNAIKKALANGTYSVNAEKVAQKLMQFEKLMPGDNST